MIDKCDVVGAVFLDLRKAFDTVNHNVTNVTLNCEGIVDISNDDVIGHMITCHFIHFIAMEFAKLLEDSTDPFQIWSAESEDVGDGKLPSVYDFVEWRHLGVTSNLHVSPLNRKLL